MAAAKVTVFGGTGFLGRRIVSALLEAGHAVRVATRNPERDNPAWADRVEPIAAGFAEQGIRRGLRACTARVPALRHRRILTRQRNSARPAATFLLLPESPELAITSQQGRGSDAVRSRATGYALGVARAVIVLGLLPWPVQADRPEYWLCVDHRGVEWAQDFPCQPSQSGVPGRGRWATTSTQPATADGLRVQSTSDSRGHTETPATIDQSNVTLPPAIQLPDLMAVLRPMMDVLVSLIPWFVLLLVLLAVASVLPVLGGLRSTKKKGALAVPSIWTILSTLFRAVRHDLKNSSPGRAGREANPRTPPTVSPPGDAQPKEWSLDVIRALEWRRFETLCQEIWKSRGHRCESTGKGGDGGVDLLVYSRQKPDQCIAVVQCKAHVNGKVGVGKVRELYGVQRAQGVRLGILMTSGSFTEDAMAFASDQEMRLFDRTRILAALQGMPETEQQNLLRRLTSGAYRTPRCPKCEALMVLRNAGSDGMRVYGCPNFPLCRPSPIKVPELKPV